MSRIPKRLEVLSSRSFSEAKSDILYYVAEFQRVKEIRQSWIYIKVRVRSTSKQRRYRFGYPSTWYLVPHIARGRCDREPIGGTQGIILGLFP